MAYQPHILIQFGGSLGAAEQWSCNLRWQIGGGPTADFVEGSLPYDLREGFIQDVGQDVYDDVRAWFVDADARINNQARLEYVKVNQIGSNGRYLNTSETHLWFEEVPPTGTVATGPYQDTLVVSLLTDATRGRANRGRIYPPTGVFTYNDNGTVSGSQITAVAGAAQELLNNLNNIPGPDLQNPRVVIASDLGNPGPVRDVTSIAVGNIVDTQQRRRKSLVETYTALPVTIV